MSSSEDRDRLLGLGRRLAVERLDLARREADAIPALTLRLLRQSAEPLDRAAAWLVWAQRRPATFLRLENRAMADGEPLVRAAVMEGVGLAGLFLELGPDAPRVRPLLDRGAEDPALPVRQAAEESRALLTRFEEAGAEEGDRTIAAWRLVRQAFLERLLPELRFSIRELLTRFEASVSLAAPSRGLGESLRGGFSGLTPSPALGLGFNPGAAEADLLRVFEELAPIATSVAEEASSRGYSRHDASALEQAALGDPALSAGVEKIQAVLRRHGRSSPTALEALAAALADLPGDAGSRGGIGS